MALTLFGSYKSSCTLKVLLTLAEKGVTKYDFVSLNLAEGDQKVHPPDIPECVSLMAGAIFTPRQTAFWRSASTLRW